jgi:hypothetical protein
MHSSKELYKRAKSYTKELQSYDFKLQLLPSYVKGKGSIEL